jgi:hypothetical protein
MCVDRNSQPDSNLRPPDWFSAVLWRPFGTALADGTKKENRTVTTE